MLWIVSLFANNKGSKAANHKPAAFGGNSDRDTALATAMGLCIASFPQDEYFNHNVAIQEVYIHRDGRLSAMKEGECNSLITKCKLCEMHVPNDYVLSNGVCKFCVAFLIEEKKKERKSKTDPYTK